MLPFHPYADLFPLIEGEEFAELVADLKANDLRERIVVLEGSILDGRNRYRAALSAGLIDEDDGPDRAKYFVRFVPSVDGDPLKFVLSKNLKRRHLNESQRAMVAARLATLQDGQRQVGKFADVPTQAQAAATLQVSDRLVRHARQVQQSATPELAAAVERGKLPVSQAAQATKLAPDTQRKIAAEADAGRANIARNVIKQERRGEREADLAEKQRSLPTKKHGLIYIDIPRRFIVHSRDTGLDRAPENHYPTMTFDEVLALPVPDLAADDCILIFWSTAASLIDDIEIMAEWGFITLRPRSTRGMLVRHNDGKLVDVPDGGGRYCSMQVWDKVRMGLGYWFRDRHEFILVGVRGNVVPPAQGTQDQSLFSEVKGEHSAKPVRVLEMIERLWPNIPKIEMFRRGPVRPGWEAWGNQVEEIEPEAQHDDPALAAAPVRTDDAVLASAMSPCTQGDGATDKPHGVLQSPQNSSPSYKLPLDDGLDIPASLRRKPQQATA